MKKICFYMAHLAKGGAQRVIINLTEYLLQNGYEVTIVTTNKADEEYELPNGAKRVFSDITEEEITGSRIRNFCKRLKKLRNVWKSENPDVVISFIGLNNMMAIVTNFFRKTPVLISVRANPTMEYYTKALRMISKTLFIKADGIILQTRQQKEYFPKAIQKKCVILPNPLNPGFVQNTKHWEALEQSSNDNSDYDCNKNENHILAQESKKQNSKARKSIVSVGRVDENKNHTMLLNAFHQIASDFPEWDLKLYGDGPDKAKIDLQIVESPWKDRIEAPGNVSDVPARLEQARVYVLTSSEEGMPNSLIEAMAKGLACISTDCPCGGPAELILNGENGILIPVKDTEALVKALKDVLSNEEYEKKLGTKASEIIKTLEPSKVCNQWKQYIEGYIK